MILVPFIIFLDPKAGRVNQRTLLFSVSGNNRLCILWARHIASLGLNFWVYKIWKLAASVNLQSTCWRRHWINIQIQFYTWENKHTKKKPSFRNNKLYLDWCWIMAKRMIIKQARSSSSLPLNSKGNMSAFFVFMFIYLF